MDTTGFSRVVDQFPPSPTQIALADTTGFSRVVDQFPPKRMQVITLHRSYSVDLWWSVARSLIADAKVSEKDPDEVTCNAINSGVEFHIQTQLLM